MAIKVYKFGLLDPVSGWDQVAIDVLFFRNRLWNNFVALEHEHRQTYRDLIDNSSDDLMVLQRRIDAINLEIETLIAQKNAERSKARSRKIDYIDVDSNLNRLKESRKALQAMAKALYADGKLRVKPLADELEKNRYNKIKQLTQDSGLWWCNSETVFSAYQIARSKAMKAKTELKFHSFDGTGQYSVRRTGGFTLNEVAAGKLAFVRIDALPSLNFDGLSERSLRSRARHHLTMTVLRSKSDDGKRIKHEVTWPIIMHRTLPDDGRIKIIQVLRKRVGNRFEWSCSITLDTSDVANQLTGHPSKFSCGIDLGFRQVDKTLRVATLADSKGSIRHFTLAQDWVESMDYVDSIQSELAQIANSVWKDLCAFLTELRDYPEQLRESIIGLLKAGDRMPVRAMRSLHRKLLSDAQLLPPALAILGSWQQRIARPSREMSDLRDKLINRRRDIYRNIASDIARSYSLVRIADIQLSDLAKVKRNDGSESRLVEIARKNRNRAALSELLLYIKQASIKTGAALEKIDTAKLTRTCSLCGHLNPTPQHSMIMSCESCGAEYDQDNNAAINCLNGIKVEQLD